MALMEPCTLTVSVGRIVAYVEGAKSHNSVALEAGIAPNSLKHVGTDEWNPTLRMLKAIEAVIPTTFRPAEPNADKRRKGKKV